jgi:chemotaxis protein CheX
MDVTHVSPFMDSFEAVMPQLGFGTLRREDPALRDHQIRFTGVMIVVGIVGELKGNVVYCLQDADARNIASIMMMGMPVDELDEMSESALSELANMLTATAATGFSQSGITIDISTPTLLSGDDVNIKMSSSKVHSVVMSADDVAIEINVGIE